jgi:hypothetical protein
MTEPQGTEDVQGLMETLLERAKELRESFGYSGDEKMLPMAFIYGDEITIMALSWKDKDEKYLMAKLANCEARKRNAKSLSFVTDSRWVKGKDFADYYGLDMGDLDQFQRDYHRILDAHEGQVKNLPRQLWNEAVVVFTNGPGIPLSIQMAPYIEGENDTIQWLPRKPDGENSIGKSDLLTDWWNAP